MYLHDLQTPPLIIIAAGRDVGGVQTNTHTLHMQLYILWLNLCSIAIEVGLLATAIPHGFACYAHFWLRGWLVRVYLPVSSFTLLIIYPTCAHPAPFSRAAVALAFNWMHTGKHIYMLKPACNTKLPSAARPINVQCGISLCVCLYIYIYTYIYVHVVPSRFRSWRGPRETLWERVHSN